MGLCQQRHEKDRAGVECVQGQRWLRSFRGGRIGGFGSRSGTCYWPPSCPCPARGQVSCPARAPGGTARRRLGQGLMLICALASSSITGTKVTLGSAGHPGTPKRVRALGAGPIALDQQPAGVWRRIVGGS